MLASSEAHSHVEEGHKKRQEIDMIREQVEEMMGNLQKKSNEMLK